jgi:hypothetical protein
MAFAKGRDAEQKAEGVERHRNAQGSGGGSPRVPRGQMRADSMVGGLLAADSKAEARSPVCCAAKILPVLLAVATKNR